MPPHVSGDDICIMAFRQFFRLWVIQAEVMPDGGNPGVLQSLQ